MRAEAGMTGMEGLQGTKGAPIMTMKDPLTLSGPQISRVNVCVGVDKRPVWLSKHVHFTLMVCQTKEQKAFLFASSLPLSLSHILHPHLSYSTERNSSLIQNKQCHPVHRKDTCNHK